MAKIRSGDLAVPGIVGVVSGIRHNVRCPSRHRRRLFRMHDEDEDEDWIDWIALGGGDSGRDQPGQEEKD